MPTRSKNSQPPPRTGRPAGRSLLPSEPASFSAPAAIVRTSARVRAMDCALAELENRFDDPRQHGRLRSLQTGRRQSPDRIDRRRRRVQTPPAALADRYASWLAALSPALSLAADPAFVEPFARRWTPSRRNRRRSSSRIAHYRAATSDLLRWRARFAVSGGPAPAPPKTDFKRNFTSSLPELMNKLAGDLIGKTVVVRDLIGAAGGAVSPAQQTDGYQVRLAAERLQAAHESLRRALLCTEEQRPLSLEAAMALAGAAGRPGGRRRRAEKDRRTGSVHPLLGPGRSQRAPADRPATRRAAGPLRWRAELRPDWCQQLRLLESRGALTSFAAA